MLDFTTIGSGESQAKVITIDSTLTILADPGWNGTDSLDFYKEHAASIDLILLSQTTTEYLGAYVHLLHTFPGLRNIPTYATLPVTKLGRIAVCEMYRSRGLLGPVEGNSIELGDIVKYFNAITLLNYSQKIHLSHVNNKMFNLSLTAYNSGYSVGGSIWLIENNINERIIYAPVWNHSKDEFLNNCKIFNNSDLVRPTTFITNCEFSSSKLSHSSRIEKLLNLIEKNIQSGTSVLLPTSLTGRFFELIIPILLNKSLDVTIYILNYTGLENLKTLSNFLEWMNSNITKLWENEKQSTTIFENNRIQIIKYEELNDLLSNSDSRSARNPKIFFVEQTNMVESSIFTQFLIDMNSKLNYSMILTERPHRLSKLNQFYKMWRQNVEASDNDTKEGTLILLEMKNVKLKSFTEELLRGKELASYEKNINERKALEAKLKLEEIERQKLENMLDAGMKQSIDSEEEEDDDDDDEEGEGQVVGETNGNDVNNFVKNDSENGGRSTDMTKHLGVEITSNIIKEAEVKYQLDDSQSLKIDEILKLPRDFDVRNMKHKGRMFPLVTHKLNVDDYGTVIKHDDFQIYDDDRFPILDDTISMQDVGKDYNAELGSGKDLADSNGSRKGKRGGRSDRRDKRRRFANDAEDMYYNNKNNNFKVSVYSLDSMVDPVIRKTSNTEVDVRCGLSFIDLGGNHDLRSLKYSTKQIKPRKVILLPEITGGDIDELMLDLNRETQNEILSKSYSSNVEIEFIKSKLNEKIDLGNVITSFEILLDEKLLSQLNWKLLNNEYNVSYVSGKIEKLKEWDYKLISDDSNKHLNTNVIHSNTKIGDIKLNQLRKLLISQNHRVELLGDGRLVVDDELIISKATDGNLEIESGLGRLFYKVKEIIDKMLATI